ncbi:MAG TPA: hypothetical protein VLM37_04120 [Fibrobacteraceae bacterium]|nr:hypothetical protein [Fibrobacteraceae bacterium]
MKKHLLLASGFALLLVIVFHTFLFDSSLLMLNSDQLNSLGSRFLRVQNFLLTQWDDSRLGGLPTLDAIFGDAYHPLVLTQWIMDPARAVGFKFILCVYIAFLSAYVLFRKVTGRWEWAALLAFLYALNPQFFTHIYGGHDGKMMVFSVAPLAIFGLLRILREGRISGMIILTLSILWMVLSAHIQLTYFFLWGAGLYTLFEIFRLRLGVRQGGSRLGMAAIALALALGMGSFQILPPYVYTTQQSVRGTDEKTSFGHAVSWSLHQEELASMLVPGFLGTDEGQSKAYWGHNVFKLNHDTAGAALTFLAFLGLFVPGNRRAAIFWFLGCSVALSYALGAHSPLFSLWYHILPGAKNFRAPAMAIFWIPLAMGMMAAPVLDILANKEKRNKLVPGAILFASLVGVVTLARFMWESMLGVPGALVTILFGALVVASLNLQDRDEPFTLSNLMNAWTNGLRGSNKVELLLVLLPFVLAAGVFLSGQKVATDPNTAPYFQALNLDLMSQSAFNVVPSAILVLLSAAAAFFLLASPRPRWQSVGLVAIIAGLNLFWVDQPYVQNVPRERYLQPDNQILQALRSDSPDTLQFPRLLSVSRQPALSGNVFSAYGMRNAMGFHDNELASYREFRGGNNSENFLSNVQNNPFLNLLNIGYVIFDTPQGTRPMRNPEAMPYASVYGAYQVVPHDSIIPMLKNGCDYRRILLVEKAPQDLPSTAEFHPQSTPMVIDSTQPDSVQATLAAIVANASQPRTIPGYAKLEESPRMDTQRFVVKADSAVVLLVAGNYHPYWKASIDGVSAPVFKAFGTLRAVVVPGGTHQVEMRFRSDMVSLSLRIAAVAFMLFLGLFVALAYQSRRNTL